MQRSKIKPLDPNTENLVADLASRYSERLVAGERVSIDEYLEQLPDEAARSTFRVVANFSRFLAISHGGRSGQPAMAEPSGDDAIHNRHIEMIH